jgi:UDP-2-acetamido-3-amino-2,3-dideoxy-glucuronate N-acetyltransferase
MTGSREIFREMSDDLSKVVLLGCGAWGRNIARVLAGLNALALICDSDENRGRAFARDLDVEFTADRAVAFARADIAAVAIATPAVTHTEMALAALDAGKHVYVEKPIALSLSDAHAMAAKAHEKSRVLMVGHLLQYHPVFVKLLALVREGALGKLQYVYSNRLNQGRIRTEENALWSLAPHDFSMILALAGESPSRVAASGQAAVQPALADLATVDLAFPSGLKAHVFCSWLNPYKEHRLTVVGDKAMAVFDDTAPEWEDKLILYRHSVKWNGSVPEFVKGAGEKIAVDNGEPLHAEMQHFLDCIAGKHAPRTDAAEATRVLEVLAAAERALDGGGAVTISSNSNIASTAFIHESAVIDADVSIGERTKVWHFAHVLGHSRIGDACVIGQNVTIGPDVTIGNGCKIQNNVSVYKGVTLEDDVFCGPSMVFTNVLTPRAHVERKNEFASTLVKRGATLGANCTIVCGHTIGEYAMVGAGAVVTKDVEPHALVLGNPARRVGWVSRSGERLGSDFVCPRTGERYAETRDGLRLK